MFEKSQWIWENGDPFPDEYAEFRVAVSGRKGILRIAAETDYAAYVNGKLAAFGSYKGFKTVRFYDEIVLDPFLTEKENEIDIVVWYQGGKLFFFDRLRRGRSVRDRRGREDRRRKRKEYALPHRHAV